MSKPGYVYIVTNKNHTTLYTGVTSELKGRAWQHRTRQGSRFASKYKAVKLVYYECFEDIYEAINREKQIKGGSRKAKIRLIESMNPNWEDLYDRI